MAKLLEARDITSGYNGAAIIKDVSLSVREGNIVSIIGPNGAGKSTLLKTLFGFLTPSNGKVMLAGDDITNISPESMVSHNAAYIFQRDNIFSNLSVKENLEMALYTQPSLFGKRSKEVLEIFPDLEKRTDQEAGSLSGGQQQMLAIACGLMLDPNLLFIDEPSAALAPRLVETVFDRLLTVNSQGTAILMVEQRVQKAMEVSDFIYVVENGENRFRGTPEELAKDEDLIEMYLGRE